MIDKDAEPALNNRTSPRWMHWLNLIWNSLVVLGAGSLFTTLIRWNPETVYDPIFRQIPNRAVYILAYACGFVALMALVGLSDSVMRLRDRRKYERSNGAGWLKFIILLFPLIVWAADAWKYSIILPDWIFSLLIFAGVLIPVIWLLRVASGRLWGRHKGRDASVITFTSSISTPFMVLLQALMVLIAAVLLATFGFSADLTIPEGISDIDNLLSASVVLLTLVIFVVVIAPLVEELFKTLAVWPLLGLDISVGEGYAAGLMSGAAFALLEGTLFAAQTTIAPGNDWVFFLLGRLGGTLIHIFNGGLAGWALARSWKDRNAARLIAIYLIAFFIHAAWNLAVVNTQLIPTLVAQDFNELVSAITLTFLGGMISIAFFFFARYVLRTTKQVDHVA